MNFSPDPTAHQKQTFPDKICLAIAADSIEELISVSVRHLQEFPFQELRLDYLPEPMASVPVLRAHIAAHPRAKILVTCRLSMNGGRFSGTPKAELDILLQAAKASCALVDLSIETAEALGPESVKQLRQVGAAVILSWHDFEHTGDPAAVINRMLPFMPDLCKVVPTATSLQDNITVLRLLENFQHHEIPQLVALEMGEKGIPSRVLSLRAGSPFTFASSDTSSCTAPGQIDAAALHKLFRISKISTQTKVFGVAGDPVRSSLSPLMLNTAFAQTGQDAVYLPLLTCDPDELFAFVRDLPVQGLSVTMPLKQTILPFLESIDPLAARIGAVNTVRRTPSGSFQGFNTDAAGIVAPLAQRLTLRGARVLVLGAGGAARAAVFGCLDRGAEVSILSRRPEASSQLAAESGAESIARDQLPIVPQFDVLINATPAGMRGNPPGMPLEPEELHAGIVFDLVYNPLETPLLRAARARGIETIPGVEMFIHQGARQFELWTGQPAPVAAMRDIVLSALRAQ